MSEKRPNETMEAYVIRLIREEERERCAKIAENYEGYASNPAEMIAYKIRELSEDDE